MGLLRLLLAIGVVAAHAGSIGGLTLTAGSVSVQAFFIISGFYMAMVLTEKYVGSSAISTFFTNRALRLLPVYWIVLGLTVLASVLGAGKVFDWEQVSRLDIAAVSVMTMVNLALVGMDWIMFFAVDVVGALYPTYDFASQILPAHRFLLVPQAWSISMEIIFYLLAPLLIMLKWYWAVALVAATMFGRFWIYFVIGWSHDPWSYRFLPFEIGMFLLGMLSYKFSVWLHVSVRVKIPVAGTLTVLLLLITALYQFIPHLPLGLKTYGYLLFVAIIIPFAFHCTKNLTVDRWLGELSYPLYVVHILVLRISGNVSPEVVLAISLVVSVFLYHFVDKPIDRIRAIRAARTKSLFQ
ncbi:MAG: hypothetical protein A3F78_16555 [Burkholderiales bacterium RIFCSPLOWO2_12_FULL_61_40]|nr:MAG: hypothetical protein A3F78_16555 [Burkholderiales bacterium RIFCSPLOWO2_12_FULL_61_40]